MQVHVHTGKNIEGHEELAAQAKATLTKSLSHFSTHITHVKIHLSDEDGDKSGQHGKRCMMEAHLEGQQPTAVSCEAATLAQAVAGAADRLKSSLQSTLERLRVHR